MSKKPHTSRLSIETHDLGGAYAGAAFGLLTGTLIGGPVGAVIGAFAGAIIGPIYGKGARIINESKVGPTL